MGASTIRPNDTLAFPPARHNDSGDNTAQTLNIHRRGSPQRQRSGRTGSGTGGHHSRNRNDITTSNLLPSDEVLCPRADVWIYLCASSFVGISSLSRAHARYNQDATSMQTQQTKMGAYTITIITLLSLNAAISLAVGIAYRYYPSLMALTRPIVSHVVSLEIILSAITLLFWMLCMFFYNNPNDAAFQIMMDMPLSQMNANFFYSLWITGILSLHLVADLGSGNYRGGVISITTTRSTTIHSTKNQTMGRLWILLFFSSILLLSFSVSLKVGPLCAGALMKNSHYCASTTIALIVSILGVILCLSYGALSSRARRSIFTIERVLALVILIGYACNAGITTSPGGSGANVGNVYVTSWLALILALILNVSYLRLHFTSRSCEVIVSSNNKREQLDALRKNSQNEELDGDEEYDEEYDDMASHVFH